jgi:hypothetical protein
MMETIVGIYREDLAPPARLGAAGEVGAYVATRLTEGAPLFAALGEDFVEARRDAVPDLLGALAADALVRRGLERQVEVAAAREWLGRLPLAA